MVSLRARLLPLGLRALRWDRRLGQRLDGRLPVTSVAPGSEVEQIAVITRGQLAGHRVWRLHPDREDAHAAYVVYLHGGAYVNGFDRRHWRLMGQLMERVGCAVVAPAYPLAPGSTAPATVEWTLRVYAEVAAAAEAEGRPIVLMGDSAGGGLALAVAVAARDDGLPLPRRVVLLSPWLDVGATSPDAVELDRRDPMLSRAAGLHAGALYAGAAGIDDWRASPLFADLAGLPPIVSFCGDRDQCVADQRRLAERAEREGLDVTVHEVPGMVHCWMLIDLPESAATVEAIAGVVAGVDSAAC